MNGVPKTESRGALAPDARLIIKLLNEIQLAELDVLSEVNEDTMSVAIWIH